MPKAEPLLIRNAELAGEKLCDVLIADGRIERIGTHLDLPSETETLDACSGALLPGLNDHHLHLAALAVARASLRCGPPEVTTGQQLIERLRRQARDKGAGDWIRGIGYHESVAGDIDAAWLDAAVDWCPLRIQHRGGRLWIFNSLGLELLEATSDAPLERVAGRFTGRLYDSDAWLRGRLGDGFPDLGAVSRELAGYGVTGLTDTGPDNGPEALRRFSAARKNSDLLQATRVMGGARLDGVQAPAGVALDARKFHLLESSLPDLDAVIAAARHSHDAGRNVAFHCVTRAELVFALAALREAGVRPGDRIEHASVTPPELLQQIADLGLTVVTQPGFVHQRGDQYLEQVATEDRPWLYRLQAFLEAGIPLAGSSDAPFGDPDPWAGMQAAVARETRGGQPLGVDEALSPEQALALYTSPLARPGQTRGALLEGEPADLCLLDRSWHQARTDLAAVCVRLTLAGGCRIWP